ncbi:MAG: hypothetical protein V4649_06910 [Bacteroidota bacterium]
MPKHIAHILWLALVAGFVSMAYYLSLLVHVPVYVTALLAVVFALYSFKKISRLIVDEPALPASKNLWASVLFIGGVVLLTNKTYYLERQYGHWDAWWIWNYHANYLAHPGYWKQLFTLPEHYHPSYPLFTSSFIAFFWRLFHTESQIIPFAAGFIITLLTPALIFLALYRRNVLMAAVPLLILATDEFYLERGVAQYSDVPLGFMLLCAMVCMAYAKHSVRVVAIVGALLGCCMWIKNEGVMLAAIFTLFHFRALVLRGNGRYFAMGILLPVIVLSVFKIQAPTTDIVAEQNGKALSYLADKSRYELVWQYLTQNLANNYFYIKAGLIAYAIICLAMRRLPARNIVLLVCCTMGFCFIYIISPKGLDWHLASSMDRVLLQLVPAFMFALASQFCELAPQADNGLRKQSTNL